ncbi:hypothetical protein [Corynebacterium pilosum]|uniref:Uncharacterized protein n=1 Tax=Corynebacterium pilosum TaxID=35756 RepID=A0A376CJX0_9CORY|nr:hypothetical protein [Corynebacterium pilosum]STC68487.1 Uncharacterised protein [Corynebacterium pilosum]
MAQEQFAGPEYFTEFDPEKFVRDLKIQAEEEKKDKEQKAKEQGE